MFETTNQETMTQVKPLVAIALAVLQNIETTNQSFIHWLPKRKTKLKPANGHGPFRKRKQIQYLNIDQTLLG